MKSLLTFCACLIGLSSYGQYRPNYFDTNSTPFNVVPGISMYIPTVYTTNSVTTNMSVTDFLFIGTAQVNYLNMLGSINQQGVVFTNYFMADTNSFAGSVGVNLDVTARNVTANIQTSTNGNGANPVFQDGTGQAFDYIAGATAIENPSFPAVNVSSAGNAGINGYWWYHVDASASARYCNGSVGNAYAQLSFDGTHWEIYDFNDNLCYTNDVGIIEGGTYVSAGVYGTNPAPSVVAAGEQVGLTVNNDLRMPTGNAILYDGVIIKSNSWTTLPSLVLEEGDNWYGSSNGIPHVIYFVNGVQTIIRLVP